MRLKPINTVRIAGAYEGGYREARIPAVAALGDGSVLMAYEARAGKSGDWGDIDIKVVRLDKDWQRSDVLTLGESRLPGDGSMRTWGNPTFIDLGGGSVLLMFCRNYEQAFLTRSDDFGKSWSQPREITPALRGFNYDWNVCALGPGHGCRLNNGRLVCPLWLAKGEYYDEGRKRRHWPSVCGAILSDDSGETWTDGFLFDGSLNPSETGCAELKDGRVLFSIRNMETIKKRLFAVSSDGGKTLEKAPLPALTDPTCFGGVCAYRGGALQINCLNAEKRTDLTVSFSADGLNWEALYGFTGRAGYADIGAEGDSVYVFAERESDEGGIIDRLELITFKACEA